MISQFLMSFLFVLFATAPQVEADGCSERDLIEGYTVSEKYQKATTLFYNNSLEMALPLIKELQLEATQTDNKELHVYALFLEAELLYENGSFNNSLQCYQKLLSSPAITRDLQFYTLISIGDIHVTSLKEFKKGIPFYKQAEALIKETDCIEKKALIYYALGSTYLINETYEESAKYYSLELDLHLKNKDYNKAAVTYSNMGNLYFEQYEDEKAEIYFNKSLEVLPVKDSTNIKLRQQINFNLSQMYAETGRHNKAFKFLTTSNTLKDSIWNRDKVWELSEIAKEFEVKQKQQEVDLLQIENEVKATQRNGLLFSALILLALLGTVFYFYKAKARSNKIIAAQKEDLDQLNATKDKLFSIVSHDLRSSVNALKTSNSDLLVALDSKKLETLDTLLQRNSGIVNGAYNLLDNLLNWALLQTKQSYFEISEQRLYFIVEQVAYNYKALLAEKNLTFENRVPKKDKVLADQESLKIILRNLMDNAIKFSNNSGSITVYTQTENEPYCNLVIEDSGIGMKEATRIELIKETTLLAKKEHEDIIGTGLGLQLVKSMIKKNQGAFSIDSTLGKGTKMIVSLKKTSTNGSH